MYVFKVGTFTIKSMDTHHKVYPILKLCVVFLRGEVWMIGGEVREITVESASKHQLTQQSFLCLIEAISQQ